MMAPPVPYIDTTEVQQAISMAEAIDALAGAFAAEELPAAPQRLVVPAGDGGSLLVMPAAGAGCAGAKLLTLNPTNPAAGLPLIQGVFVLFAAGSMEPRAVIDGGALTELRTAAVSGVATRLLARPDAHRLVIFGAGVQARGHLIAMQAVRPIDDVVVVDPDSERVEAFLAFAAQHGVAARAGTGDAVADADLVCTCTTSPEPVFEGAQLASGAHINAMGSYQRHTREVDDDVVRRAWIAVETREAAMAEAGDLTIPMAAGLLGADAVRAELAELAAGRIAPVGDHDVTLFKSVGIAFEDLVVARAVVDALDAA